MIGRTYLHEQITPRASREVRLDRAAQVAALIAIACAGIYFGFRWVTDVLMEAILR